MSSPGAGSADAADAQAERDAAWNEVKTALQSGAVRAPVATSVGGTAMWLPSCPQINVEGRDEHIPLPVDADTAAALMALPACAPAPFGRGTETVLDSSYRACHQVDASAVTIRGRGTEWRDGLRALVEHVCKSFELPATKVVSTPYKLLLYGPGGHFKAHRDTEKADRMFGTLIVQFPSNHDGGALVVRHGGSEVVHGFGAAAAGSTADAGASSCHFAAHYADLEHELTEVTRGYRLAMVYLLCYTGEAASTPVVFAGTSHLAARLAAPLELAMRPPAVVPTGDERFKCDAGFKLIRLSHDYTLQSLRESGAAALKDRDAVVWAALRAANTQAADPCAMLLMRIDWAAVFIGYTADPHDEDVRALKDIEYTPAFVHTWGGVDDREYRCRVDVLDGSGSKITGAPSARTPCAPCMLRSVLFSIPPPDTTFRGGIDDPSHVEWNIMGHKTGRWDTCPDADDRTNEAEMGDALPRTVLPLFGDAFWPEGTEDAGQAYAMGNQASSYEYWYNPTAIMLIATAHPQFASIKEALAKAAALSVNARPESSSKTGAEGAAGGAGGHGAASEAPGGAGAS